MSLFKKILSKIFDNQPDAPSPKNQRPSAPTNKELAGNAGAAAGGAAGAAFGNRPNSPTSLPPIYGDSVFASTSREPVDVAAVMDRLADAHAEKLDWKRSIVDLMKLLDMDSSLSSRKELAAELNYDGDTSDSAKMNIWLHKQVLKKVADNGGRVPSDLLV